VKSPNNNAPDVLLRASQRRVEELEKALQSAYSWGYFPGELSELDEIMETAAVPIPEEIATRTRMVRVWSEGFRKHPGWTPQPEERCPRREVAWMLHYSSLLPEAPLVSQEMVREWLWKTARAASNLLSEDLDVLALALEEYSRAAKKHPGMTLECSGHTEATRLFALVEEIFGRDNLFGVTPEEAYYMSTNVVSLSPDALISDRHFTRLNAHLREAWGMTVEEVPYQEISKMGGLLRCSTMPLIRD